MKKMILLLMLISINGKNYAQLSELQSELYSRKAFGLRPNFMKPGLLYELEMGKDSLRDDLLDRSPLKRLPARQIPLFLNLLLLVFAYFRAYN